MKNKYRNNKSRDKQTRYVFSENNQVYLKKEDAHGTTTSDAGWLENEAWYPVNFQWIPVMKMKKS